MSTRQSCILGGSLIVCSLILGLSFGPRSRADEKAEAPAGPPLRYQMHVIPGQGADEVIVFDSATGQTWVSGTGAKTDDWKDLGVPGRPGKK